MAEKTKNEVSEKRFRITMMHDVCRKLNKLGEGA